MNWKKIMVVFDVPLFLVNYLFIIVCARELGVDEFGQLNGFLSVLSIVFIFGIVLQIENSQLSETVISISKIKTYSIYAICCGLIMSIFLSYDVYANATLIVICLLHPFVSTVRGRLIGEGRYHLYYTNIYIEMVIKLSALFLLFFNHDKYLFVLLSLIVGQFFAFAHACYLSRGQFGKIKKSLESHLKINIHILLNQASFFLLLGIDFIFLAKFSPEIAGEQSICIRVCQVPFMLVFTLLQFDLKEIGQPGGVRRIYSRYLFLIPLLFTLSFLFIIFFGEILVGLLIGAKYSESLTYAPLYFLYFGLISLHYVHSLIQASWKNLRPTLHTFLFLLLTSAIYVALQGGGVGIVRFQIFSGVILSVLYFSQCSSFSTDQIGDFYEKKSGF